MTASPSPISPTARRNPGKDRVRTCVGTGEQGAPDGFIRFVVDSRDGANLVTPDFNGKLPGRGAWVKASRAALEKAIAKGGFARSFKSGVRAPADLVEAVEAGLARQALSALGLARRAGAAATGFDQAAALLKAGDAAALVSACDGAADGKRKLKARALAGLRHCKPDADGAPDGDSDERPAPHVAFVDLFDVEALSQALGRDGVVHVALRRAPASFRFLKEARRLAGFCKDGPGVSAIGAAPES
ncbi:MAG: DUF448 domain-containing protein [Pseudomonadota bacterium]